MNGKIKALIVDDSSLMRKAVRKIFEDSERIELAGEAHNGQEALELLAELSPDVVVLDVNMPVMDGLTTLKHLMIQAPTPTVMLSTLTKEGSATTFDSLKYGAVDFLTKPSSVEGDLGAQFDKIIDKVTKAAKVETTSMQYIRPGATPTQSSREHAVKKIVALGGAEGGYSCLLKVIPALSVDLPIAFIVILYADTENIDAFVRYLDNCSSISVNRATEGAPVKSGVCYIGSGAEYVTILEKNGEFLLHVSPAPFSTRRGSIDMLMLSAAELAGDKAVGVVVSGEGDDGAEGLCEITANGGTALVQKPESCMYREMSDKALQSCNSNIVVSDNKMAQVINLCCG